VAPGRGRHRARGVRRGGKALLAEREGRTGELARWRAERKPGWLFLGALVSVAALAAWGARHAWQSAEAAEGTREPFAWVYALVFLVLAWQTAAAYLERPHRGGNAPDGLKTAVVVPVFNEDETLLERGLESLLSQSRRPDAILVADDGSAKEDGTPRDYSGVRRRFEAAARAAGVAAWWTRLPVNQGKRHAHAAAFVAAAAADVYVTGDSDAILDYFAVEEGMKPFADPEVQSVAGLLLIANHRRKLLPPPVPAEGGDGNEKSRLARVLERGAGLASNCKKTVITRSTELWYVTSELTDRSAQSLMSSVLVNTGTFALYRGEVIRECLDAYVNETFAGRRVQFSDDSMLTLFALLKGKTVQQPTAIGFTAMPDNLSHHGRQYLRWMRGMTIRTFWRFRYLPLNRFAYWQHMLRWVQACVTVPVFFTVVVVEPVLRGSWSPGLLLVPVLIGYGRCLRYLTIRRYDEPWWSQLVTYSLAPAVALWQYTVLRAIWWYGMATCLKTGWGTRQNGVEVTL
jgi:hyaluronan synthase